MAPDHAPSSIYGFKSLYTVIDNVFWSIHRGTKISEDAQVGYKDESTQQYRKIIYLHKISNLASYLHFI